MRKIYASRGPRGFPGYRGRGYIVSRRHQTYRPQQANPIAVGCAALTLLGMALFLILIAASAH
jgi:hypothetical protein